jgi:DNA repair photolyase
MLLARKLESGLKNKNPKTPLAHCLAQKKTIRWGNKSDPFQPAERIHKLAPTIFSLLWKYEWSFVIQTRFTEILMDYDKYLRLNFNLVTIMPVISPGLEKDWEILERGKTTPIPDRFQHIKYWIDNEFTVGVNGEPFIPGFHTVDDFENTLKLLKEYKVRSYNVYNFHFNAFVAKRLAAIGIDIEKIWYYNQDAQWKKILPTLLNLSIKYGIRLGCPDFVNSGPDWIEKANTCCGVNVPNPCTFNTHYFKKLKQRGKTFEEIMERTYDGSGDIEQATQIIKGEKCEFYTLKDAGL